MEIPLEFQTIKQPAGSLLCGAAVCAMAIGKSLDEVLAEAGDWRRLAYVSGIAGYLAQHGVTFGLWLEGCDPSEGRTSIEFDPQGHPAIVAVKSGIFKDAEHWVFWDGKQYRDPSPREQRRYHVLETHFLSYWPGEPPWIERLPADGMAAGLDTIMLPTGKSLA